jgi:hypothetical protein
MLAFLPGNILNTKIRIKFTNTCGVNLNKLYYIKYYMKFKCMECLSVIDQRLVGVGVSANAG